MKHRGRIDPIARHSVETELRSNSLSGAELSEKLGIPRPMLDRILGELMSSNAVNFDGRSNCYCWAPHSPNVDTQK